MINENNHINITIDKYYSNKLKLFIIICIIISTFLISFLLFPNILVSAQTTVGNSLLQSSSNGIPSTLTIISQVNNSAGGKAFAANFSQIVTNTYKTSDGYGVVFHLINGSENGVSINLLPGLFNVFEIKNETDPITSNYNQSYSGDCNPIKSVLTGSIYGIGIMGQSDKQTCRITNTFHK